MDDATRFDEILNDAVLKAIGDLRAENETLRGVVIGWREWDWPVTFDRATAEMMAQKAKAALGQLSDNGIEGKS